MLTQGLTVDGPATDELERITSSLGLEWSIQDEKLQLLALGKSLRGKGVRLAPETGLLGAPSIDKKGVVTAECLMIPDVFPGRRIQIEGENLRVIIRADRCHYTGDTFGDDWTIEVSGKEERRA